jgi:hypothetical protein
VVARGKDGTALVLTNHRVVAGLGTGQVTFRDGDRAVVAVGQLGGPPRS